MSKILDTCPKCGENDLVAVCSTIVEYTIHNEPDGETQSWDTSPGSYDDDSSELIYVKCDSCKQEWHVVAGEVEMDEKGYYIVGLKETAK
jgi:hypothetical protein